MADQRIEIPVIYTEDTSGLSKAAAETAKLQKQTEEFIKVQKQAFEESAKSAGQLADQLQETGAEMADIETTTRDASKSGEAFKGVVRDNIRGLSLFGRNLGEIIDGLRAKQVALKGVISGLGGASNALKIFRLALISTGIGALIVALGSLAVFLTRTEEGANKLSQAMAGIGAGANVVIKRIAELGGEVESMIEKFSRANPEISKAGEKLSDLGKYGPILGPIIEGLKFAFSGLASEIGEAAEKAILLEESSQRLADAERNLAVEASKRRIEIERSREIADDEAKSYAERARAAKATLTGEQSLLKERIALAQQELFLINEKNKLEVSPDREAAAQAEIKLNDLQAEAAKQERQDEAKIQALLRQHQREVRKLAEEERKRNEQRLKIEAANRQAFQDLQKSLAQQINDEEQLAANEKERLEFQRDNALAALQTAEHELIARAKFLGQEEEISKIQTDFARLRALTTERYEREITKVVEEEQAKQLKAREDASEEFLNEQERIRNRRIKFVEDEAKLEETKLELVKQSGQAELNLEQYIEQEKLEIQRKALLKKRQILLETDTTGTGVNLPDVKQIDAEIAVINDKLTGLLFLPVFERIKNKFKSLFNLSDEDVKAIGDQIQQITGNIFDGLQALNDAELTQQSKLVDARQERVDELRNQLDEELRLKEQGYANNSDLLKSQLNTETELLKKEEEKRLALEKKAANLRLKQDALQIASSIALSVAKAVEANSKFGLVGIVTAAAQIASIFALIAKAKAQAAEFAAPPKLRQGGDLAELFSGKVKGAGHEAGGVKAWMHGQSRPIELEGKEFVMPVEPAQEHGSFLENMRKGKFSGVDIEKYLNTGKEYHEAPAKFLKHAPLDFLKAQPYDYLADMLPTIREAMAESVKLAAIEKSEQAKEIAALRGEIGTMQNVLKDAIEGIPIAIPITEAGYLVKQKRGNTTSVNIYDPPKRNTQK